MNPTEALDLYERLRAIMRDTAPQMEVVCNEPGRFELQSTTPNPVKPSETLWFGAVRVSKAYVSYHLMALYLHPQLVLELPTELRRRMQGKTCFNFRRLDQAMTDCLVEATRRCVSLLTGDVGSGSVNEPGTDSV